MLVHRAAPPLRPRAEPRAAALAEEAAAADPQPGPPSPSLSAIAPSLQTVSSVEPAPAVEANDDATRAPKAVLSAPPPVVAAARLMRPSSPDPEARQRAQIRTVQASVLDARLERRMADLRARLERARGAEKEALASDLALLERNLVRRRASEQEDSVGPSRRATEVGR